MPTSDFQIGNHAQPARITRSRTTWVWPILAHQETLLPHCIGSMKSKNFNLILPIIGNHTKIRHQ